MHTVPRTPTRSRTEPAPAALRAGRLARLALALRAPAAYVVAQLAVLRLLETASPRFFVHEPHRLVFFSDVQAQFLPVMWWMGRHADPLSPPLVDPDVGGNGNFTADMQYGALDPLHWVVLRALAAADDFVLFSWALAAGTLTLTGLGVLAVLRRAGVRATVAVPTALGAVTSGFLLFFGSDWWPVLWTAPAFPWLWYGLLRRDLIGALVAGTSTWVLLNGGNVYLVPFGVVLVVTVVVLEVRARGSLPAALRQRWLGGALLAMTGGAVAAAPTLLTVAQLGPFAGRPHEQSLLGNTAFGVPNALDVVVGGASLHAIVNDWLGAVQQTPAFATFVVALPALALVDWRRALHHPVVLTALVLVASAALATQLPAVVGVLRIPFRYVLVVHLVLPVLAAVGVTVAPQLTRRRLTVAGLLVAGQAALALSRAPALVRWHAIALVVAAAALAAFVVVLRPGTPARRRLVAGAVVCLAAGSQVFVGLGQLVDIHAAVQARFPEQIRFQGSGYDLGTTVADVRDHALEVDAAVTVLQYDSLDLPPAVRQTGGVLYGEANLLAGLRTGFGYSAVKHTGTVDLECGGKPTCVRLLEPAPVQGGVPWLDLVAADRVYVSMAAPREVVDHLESSPLFESRGTVRGYALYARVQPLTGRVTWTEGVDVDPGEWTSTFAALGRDQERYRVTTGDDAGRVVLRVPYWPGYAAAVDGERVPVTALGDSLLAVELPAGLTDAALTVRYEPLGVRLFWPLQAAGLVLLAGGAVLAGRRSATDRPLGTT
ncbi:hypothetical protein ACI79D_11810 [Geodermatophilus sp. SYSU D00708]